MAPAGVNVTPRRLRTSSGPPIFSSRLLIRLLSAGWETWRRAAARPKCRSSARTAKDDRSRVSSCINQSYHRLTIISLDESPATLSTYKHKNRSFHNYVNGLPRNGGGFL